MHIYIHTSTINALNIPQGFVLNEDKILLTHSSNGVRMTWCIGIENIYCCFTYILMPRNMIITYFRITYFHVSNGAIFFYIVLPYLWFHIDVVWTLCIATHLSKTITNAVQEYWKYCDRNTMATICRWHFEIYFMVLKFKCFILILISMNPVNKCATYSHLSRLPSGSIKW